MRAVLRRAPTPANVHDFITAGNLKLDFVARRAYLSDDELQLSQKEFDLLAELAQEEAPKELFQLAQDIHDEQIESFAIWRPAPDPGMPPCGKLLEWHQYL